jgi:hypothetical protein
MIKNALKRLLPSGTEYVAGALTAGVMFLGNHVFHVQFMESSVETALTPFASLLVAAIVHKPAAPAAVPSEPAPEPTPAAPAPALTLVADGQPQAALVAQHAAAVAAMRTPLASAVAPASTEAPHIVQ